MNGEGLRVETVVDLEEGVTDRGRTIVPEFASLFAGEETPLEKVVEDLVGVDVLLGVVDFLSGIGGILDTYGDIQC